MPNAPGRRGGPRTGKYKAPTQESPTRHIANKESMNKIQKARKTMRDAFDADSDFKMGYIANIAMLLHDHHGITNYEKRNAAAEDILKLIFYS